MYGGTTIKQTKQHNEGVMMMVEIYEFGPGLSLFPFFDWHLWSANIKIISHKTGGYIFTIGILCLRGRFSFLWCQLLSNRLYGEFFKHGIKRVVVIMHIMAKT